MTLKPPGLDSDHQRMLNDIDNHNTLNEALPGSSTMFPDTDLPSGDICLALERHDVPFNMIDDDEMDNWEDHDDFLNPRMPPRLLDLQKRRKRDSSMFTMLQSSAVQPLYVRSTINLTYLAVSLQSSASSELFSIAANLLAPIAACLWCAYSAGPDFQTRPPFKLRYPFTRMLLGRWKLGYVRQSSSEPMFDDASNNSLHSWPENYNTPPLLFLSGSKCIA
ncbi:hypothetical protein SOVF_089210 [Spinacia oleracea]|nr:hypothetical protein SOVF_089210 [Spinacia oleracea]